MGHTHLATILVESYYFVSLDLQSPVQPLPPPPSPASSSVGENCFDLHSKLVKGRLSIITPAPQPQPHYYRPIIVCPWDLGAAPLGWGIWDLPSALERSWRVGEKDSGVQSRRSREVWHRPGLCSVSLRRSAQSPLTVL